MKTRNLTLTVILAALLGLSVPTQAQVFIQEEGMESSSRILLQGGLPDPDDPGDDNTGDHGGTGQGTGEYTPLGGGILVLGCLGGAYLLGRRRKERE